MWLLITAALLVVGCAIEVRSVKRTTAPGRNGFGPASSPVTAEPARTADLNVRIVALGTVTPVSTVTVRTRIDGQLQAIHFDVGTTVAAGAPRSCAQLHTRIVSDFTRSLEITPNRHKQGVDTRADVAAAETQLKAAQTQAIDISLTRTQLAHTTAALPGQPPATFSLAPAALTIAPPAAPALIPSF